jgi:uncharacterized membrane protein
MNEEIIIPVAFFASIAFILYYFFKYRYLERQALIEKGMTVEELKKTFRKIPREKNRNEAAMAKWGIILIAIGLAILIGTNFSDEILLGLIFMFPGIGLLLYYKFIAKRVETEE